MSLKIVGTNFAVFLLFFGAAALDAFRSKNIWNAAFLLGDNAKRKVRAA